MNWLTDRRKNFWDRRRRKLDRRINAIPWKKRERRHHLRRKHPLSDRRGTIAERRLQIRDRRRAENDRRRKNFIPDGHMAFTDRREKGSRDRRKRHRRNTNAILASRKNSQNRTIGFFHFFVFIAVLTIFILYSFSRGWDDNSYWLMNLHRIFRIFCDQLVKGILFVAFLSVIFSPLRHHIGHILSEILDCLAIHYVKFLVLLTFAIFFFFSAMKISAYLLYETNHDFVWYINTIWNTLHGRWFYSSLGGGPFFATHFTPIIGIFGPLLLIWKSPCIIILAESALQALALPLCFRLAKILGQSKRGAVVWTLMLAFNPFFHHNTQEWFHPVSLGITIFLLWFACYELRSNWIYPVTILALSLNEAVPLLLFGLGLIAFVEKRWHLATFLLIISIASAWIELMIIIPSSIKGMEGATEGHAMLSNYVTMNGDVSFVSQIKNVLGDLWNLVGRWLRPFCVVSAVIFLATTGAIFFTWFKPIDLIPLVFSIAPYMMELGVGELNLQFFGSEFWTNSFKWHHAAAPLAVILWSSLRGMIMVRRIPRSTFSYLPIFFLLLGAFGINICWRTVAIGPSTPNHFSILNRAIASVPENASLWCPPAVSAHSPFREKIKSLPVAWCLSFNFQNDLFDPDYIVAFEPLFSKAPYDSKYQTAIKNVLTRFDTNVVFREGEIIVLRIIKTGPNTPREGMRFSEFVSS